MSVLDTSQVKPSFTTESSSLPLHSPPPPPPPSPPPSPSPSPSPKQSSPTIGSSSNLLVGTKDLSDSRDILQRSYEIFRTLDKNNQHRIDARELESTLNRFTEYMNVSPEQAKQVIRIATKGANDSLSFSQFHTVYAALNIVTNLKQTDMHHLSVTDIKNALIKAGLTPTRAQVERMFALGDQYKTYDRLGPIDFTTFLEIYVNTPYDASEVFLHSWFSAGRNATPYNKPAELNPLEDFLAGTAAGVALTLVGHPFDTVKVRMQTETGFSSGIDTFLKTVRKEGILALYKGMAGPMLTIPIVNAVVFAAYAQAKDVMHKFQTEPKPLTLSQITLAGAYAGLVNCFICCPTELIKTRLQIQYNSPLLPATPGPIITGPVKTLTSPEGAIELHRARKPYWTGTFAGGAVGTEAAAAVEHPNALCKSAYQPFTGPLDAVTRIVQQNGIKGLFRGMSATIYREIPGYGGQFFAYEGLKRLFTKEGEKVENLGAFRTIMAGGIAGLAGWVVSYPMDFVKSQIQAEPFDTKSPYHHNKWLLDGGFISCWKETVRKGGHMALWRGFAPCVARAFPANAAGFWAYEGALKLIRKIDYGDTL